MAHQLESMFSVIETPWHGLGKIVREAPTAADAIKLAGLDWNVSKRPVKVVNPDGSESEAKGFVAIVRDSDQTVFNVLGEGFTPLQNSKVFDFFNPFIEAGLASFETAGSLRGGRNVWALAKLNKAPIEVGKGDAVNKFLLLSNGHDGTMACRVGFTPIRVVCANTLAAAHGAQASKLVRLMHSKNVATNVEKLREIINAADAKFEATAEQYRELARRDVHRGDLRKYVNIVFGFSEIEDERRQLAQKKTLESIERLFTQGRGMNLKSAKGTYWGLYNAVTEYLSYESGRSEDRRLYSLWFSQSARINQRALHTAMEMARVA